MNVPLKIVRFLWPWRLGRWLLAVEMFSAIVWRPVTGPSRDEPPMTWWQCQRAYGLDARTAWQVASDIWMRDTDPGRHYGSDPR